MAFLIQTLATVLLFVQASSFEVHTIWKEITPIGWIVIIAFPLALLLGAIFLIAKFLKKPKLK